MGTSLKLCRWSLVPTETRDQYISGAKKDSAPVIDLLSHGYAKLLGKGKDQNLRWRFQESGRTNS